MDSNPLQLVNSKFNRAILHAVYVMTRAIYVLRSKMFMHNEIIVIFDCGNVNTLSIIN